ncbi:hypothetical protein GF420_16515 [candidate division GN15 bacterium]|nr:hypothetical protein [candidate division GN15 bacterium]
MIAVTLSSVSNTSGWISKPSESKRSLCSESSSAWTAGARRKPEKSRQVVAIANKSRCIWHTSRVIVKALLVELTVRPQCRSRPSVWQPAQYRNDRSNKRWPNGVMDTILYKATSEHASPRKTPSCYGESRVPFIRYRRAAHTSLCMLVCTLGIILPTGCSESESSGTNPAPPPAPVCMHDYSGRADLTVPDVVVADWGTPVRLDAPVNTDCPQDAIEISPDSSYLYVMYTEALLDSLSPEQITARHNNTYRLPRLGAADTFGPPEYFDLSGGVENTLDGELSFAPDSPLVYFHSLRIDNLGYQQNPPTEDFLDIYEADLVDGMAVNVRNLGPNVNSVYPDGEHAIHPDGRTLYFGSLRPGGSGNTDIWMSTRDSSGWTPAVNLGTTINSLANDYQPTFTADGDTMYFASGRNPLIGMAIYRSVRTGDTWGAPALVIQGLVGEPSLTADGRLLYFVHIRSDAGGNYDSDVWLCRRAGS